MFLQEYNDSHWVGNATNIKRTLSCYRKQTNVSLSATKDEYIASKKKSREDSLSDEEYDPEELYQ